MYVMCQCSLLNFGTVQTVIFYRSSVREITYYSLPSSELLRFLVQNSVQKQSVLYHPGFNRLRVVPHFSSGIVERAKRERA